MNYQLKMKATKFTALLLMCAALPLAAAAGSPSTPATLATCRPQWSVGDWWTVDSQRYDRGENRPGATPAWLEKETWKFSVDATNVVDGEACYEVSIKPEGQNRCPYWFVCSFRMRDLLVMRRELHQPGLAKSGRAASAPVVESNFSKDDETPFVPDDFPNLPLTVPHFAGAATNAYRAASPAPRTGTTRKSPRSVSASTTQAFRPGEKMTFTALPGAKSMSSASAVKSGVIVLSTSADKFERQSWDNAHPWPIYAEKWEFNELIRKSWLTDFGHSATQPGGAK